MNFFTFFYRNQRALILAILGILLVGLSAFLTLPRMEDPRLRNRVAILLTPWPGVSAERVEALVTDPIEDKVRELSEFEVIESVSRAGLSFILVELDESITDIEPVWSKVRGKVQDAESTLPKGAGPTRFDDTRGAVAFSLIVGLKWVS